MKTDNPQKLRADRVWLSEDSCDLEDFAVSRKRPPRLPIIPPPRQLKKTC